ncbi:hypothetical protein [Rhodococcus zopfii]|uniref:hypothetical protein n=1 Tax=Rhodococcus zopfii TaxID=43772 RepID=UPI0035276AD9
MTNPQDPRTPQERAYSLDESHETRALHTSDPTEAYGRAEPTQALPPYGQVPGQGYQPTQQFSPTEQFRQHDAPQEYQATQQYQPTQQYGYGPGGPGVPPGQPPAPESREPRRRWLLPALGALVVIALAGVFGYLLSGGSGTDSTSASAPTTRVAPPSATTRTQPPATEPSLPPTLPLDRLPGGLGDAIGSSGTTVGTVTANDGSSITISGIGGAVVTVRLMPGTQIIALAGSSPSALRVGDTVLAQGTPVRDGEMTADTVVSATVPGFSRSGN